MALRRLCSAECDVFDADFSELLPVALLAGVVFAAFELEDNDFVIEPVLDDLSGDFGTRQGWDAKLYLSAFGAKQNVVELDGRTGFAKQRGDSESFTRLGAELLATGADDRVAHGSIKKVSF